MVTAHAKDGEHKIQGHFTVTNFSGPDCPSPIDLCASGTFRGTLNGPVTVVATSLTPTSQPGVLLGTADLVIHDRRGDLTCTETFIFSVAPGDDGAEGVVCQFTGGTGKWAGVTGYFAGYGFNPPGEASTGRYEGKLVLP